MSELVERDRYPNSGRLELVSCMIARMLSPKEGDYLDIQQKLAERMADGHNGREIHIGFLSPNRADFHLRTAISLVNWLFGSLQLPALASHPKADSEDAQNCRCRNDQRKLDDGLSPTQTSAGISEMN